jgi:hypothetical protein
MGFTRRAFVTVGLGGAVLSQAVAAPASATPGDTATDEPLHGLTADVIQSAGMLLFSADFSTTHSVRIGTLIRLAADPALPAGTSVTVQYDPNLTSEAPGVILEAGRARELPTTVVNIDERTSRATVIIPRVIGRDAESLDLAVPLSTRELYPGDNYGRPADIIVETRTPAGAVARSTISRTADVAAVQPWGVDIACGWTAVAVTDAGRPSTYRFISHVRVESVGPFPVPPGLKVTVQADARVVHSTTVGSVTTEGETLPQTQYRVSSGTEDGVAGTEILFAPELAAGAAWTLALESEMAPDREIGEGVVFARAFAAASDSTSRPERSTGRRLSIAISDSGRPIASTDAQGKV